MLLDIATLQFLYGANQNGATGATPGTTVTVSGGRSTYAFTDQTAPECIWVGSKVSSNNTFDFSACSGKVLINLSSGSFSTTGYLNNSPYNNVSIAYGTVIQNAVGNNAGDIFIANAANDSLTGGLGDDTFTVGAGTDSVIGGGGSDTAIFHDPRSSYRFSTSVSGNLVVTDTSASPTDGTAILSGITTLQFSDQAVSAVGVTPTTVSDSAANVVGNLDSLQTLVSGGKLSSIALTDSKAPTLSLTVTQLANDAAALYAISSSYTVNVTGGATPSINNFLAQQDVSGRGLNGVAADYAGVAPSGGNSVIGFQSASLPGGYNTVILDGARSNYAVQVNADGTTTIKDIGTGDATFGQTVTVSGASYLLFNGGASTMVSGLPVYTQAYFVESAANAQLAQFYAAATQFKSSIALSGLEYWENKLAGGMSLASIAQSFLNTGYFQTTYGDPGTTHAQHVSFVQALYQNILGMTLSSANGGVAYWAGQMDGGVLNGAQTLISFTNATANTSTTNAVSGAAPGSGSGWLITPSVVGGYADPGMQMAAATVMTQAATSNFYNLSLVDPASLGASGITSGGVTLASGSVTIGSSASAATVYLSSSFTQATVNNNGSTVHDGPGADIITVSGSNDIITLGSASTDTLNLANASGAYVFKFSPGKGSLLAASGITHPTSTAFLNGTTTPVNGAVLSFGNAPIYVNVGNIGGGSAAELVTAANAVYRVADSSGEHVLFVGTDSGGNAQIWSFTAHAADSHQVIASELTQIVTVIGVAASSLSAADLA